LNYASHTVSSTRVDLLYPQIVWKLRTEKFNRVQLSKRFWFAP